MKTLEMNHNTSTMNTLSIDQMEAIDAGSCDGAIAGAATLLFAAAIFSGPVGWGILAAGAVAGTATGVNIGIQCFT